MAINWETFKKLIGNGKRKYVSRDRTSYIFISYNNEEKHITVMKLKDYEKDRRKLYDMPLEHFVSNFTFVKQTEEKPIF